MINTFRAGIKFGTTSILVPALILLASAPLITPVTAHAAEVINAWWPTSGAHMTGVQPFKAMISGLDVSSYDMFWQVDNGQLNSMDSNYTGYQHKEASVDVTNWNWHGSGPYAVNFVARKNGVVIANASVTIYVDSAQSARSTGTVATTPSAITITTATPTSVAAPSPIVITSVTPTAPQSSSNPLANLTFYVNPNSAAAQQAAAWASSNPTGARMMQTLAAQSTAVWLGEWNTNVTQDVQRLVSNAQSSNSVPVFVAYAIPQRDCGGYSSGGTNSPAAYSAWIKSVAAGIGSGKAVVILEPDALAQITCLSSNDQATRLSLISNAVSTLKANAGTKVYIDAAHSGWIDATTMADRLTRANVSSADGFALNVSNFVASSNETAYGTAISKLVHDKHFVIDTSRNGNGSDGSWCNPSGRAIGVSPKSTTGNALVDAFLWLKVPGESDGTCNGGPSAGTWWSSYAVSLVANAH